MGGTTNSYHLGIDLGTTYTAAAVHRSGHTQMATLGNRAAAALGAATIAAQAGTAARHETVEAGSGSDPLGSGDEVTFQFIGRLADGTVFVNSWETSGEVTVTLGDGTLIDGFEEALHGLVAGDWAEGVHRQRGRLRRGGEQGRQCPTRQRHGYLVDITAVNRGGR